MQEQNGVPGEKRKKIVPAAYRMGKLEAPTA